jgi:UDP-N-acetylmuramoylalanine--D-glutamate ligase
VYNKISILGLGKSAISALNFLQKNYPKTKIKVSELKARSNWGEDPQIQKFEKNGIEFEFGKQSFDFVKDADFIMISPGIPQQSTIIQDIFTAAKKSQLDYGTDLDLLVKLNCPHGYYAVTGTNGKTTTTSLLAHILGAEALGNIGVPFLEHSGKEAPVLEISSFQLFYSTIACSSPELSPKVAVHLNFTPDHLDWHSSLDEYRIAKEKLFMNMRKQGQYLVLNYDDEYLRDFGLGISKNPEYKSQILFFSTRTDLAKELAQADTKTFPYYAYLDKDSLLLCTAANKEQTPNCISATKELKLVGEHNYSNTLACTLAALAAGASISQIQNKVKSFQPVEHRLEFVTNIDGKNIYNDSKATNPDSAIKSLLAFDKCIAIVGGKEKNLDLRDFTKMLSQKTRAVIAIGEIKERIIQELQEYGFNNYERAASLEEALDKALKIPERLPVVLAPASSSFDMFKSYEDRGRQFKALALKKASAVKS